MSRIIRHSNGKDLINHMREDLTRWLGPFDFQYAGMSDPSAREWAPSIDVKEEEKCFVVYADVPGVKAKDIDVSMDNGILTIKGHRALDLKEKEENYLRVERFSGSFIRQITFPESVDQSKISAKCTDGTLQITLPKKEHSAGRKIEVKGS